MPSKGLGKWDSNAIQLWTPLRSRTGCPTHKWGNRLGFVRRIGRCVITRPLNVIRNQIHQLKPSLNRLNRQILNHLSGAYQNCLGLPNDFPIRMIRVKNDPKSLSITTGDIQNIRAISPVNDQDFYFSLMKAMGFPIWNIGKS